MDRQTDRQADRQSLVEGEEDGKASLVAAFFGGGKQSTAPAKVSGRDVKFREMSQNMTQIVYGRWAKM